MMSRRTTLFLFGFALLCLTAASPAHAAYTINDQGASKCSGTQLGTGGSIFYNDGAADTWPEQSAWPLWGANTSSVPAGFATDPQDYCFEGDSSQWAYQWGHWLNGDWFYDPGGVTTEYYSQATQDFQAGPGSPGSGINADDSGTYTFTLISVPTATLSANPTSIVSGNSSALTWSSANATSCTGTNFSTGGATSGTVSVSPSTTTTYSVVCSGAGGTSAPVNATVTIIPPAVTASCSANLTNVQTFSPLQWTVNASGGTGAYTYSWTGTQGLTGTNQSVTINYPHASGYQQYGTTPFTKPNPDTAGVTVTSGGNSTTITCTNTVTVCAGKNEIITQGNDNAPYPPDQTHGDDPRCCNGLSTTGGQYRNSTVCEGAAPLLADLSAGAITPTTATAGTQVLLQGTVSNTGSRSTVSGFTDLFQKADTASGGNASDIGTFTSAAIAANSSNVASFQYPFPLSDGGATKYVRVCADEASAADTGTISESDETNNCGPWTAVAVATPPVALSATCSVLGTPITAGQSATWASAPSGGTAPYTYSWAAIGGAPSSGTASSLTSTYASVGTYSASVTVRDALGATTGSVTCSNTLSVNNAPVADIRGDGAPPQTSAYVNASQNFTGTVTNIGNATGTSFPNQLEIADASGAHLAYAAATPNPMTLAGGNTTAGVSANYIFTSAGTYKVRFCGDEDSSGAFVISESSYGNNCGLWQTVTATLPIATLTLSTGNIQKGGTATLSWSSSNASSCTGKNFSTGNATSGSVSVSPQFSTRYRVTCTDAAGNSASDKTKLMVLTGTVPPGSPTATLGATPEQISTGGTSLLTWSSTNATACTSTTFSTGNATSGSVSVSPSSTTDYDVTCTNATASASDGATVIVNGVPPTDTADLSATDVTPIVATAGTPQVYSGTLTNGGLASTGTSYNNLFQFDSNSDHTTVDATQVVSAGPTASGGSTVVSSTAYNFGVVGTSYVRICADNNASFVGTITESDESNNCGPWTAITVSAAPVALGTSCSVVPTVASTSAPVTWTAYPTGGTAPYTYSWTATGGTPATGSASTLTNSYSSPGTYAASITVKDALNNSTTTACTSNADNNATTPDGPTVGVSTPPTGSLTASSPIIYGANSTLTYSCSSSANAAIDQGALATTTTLSGAPLVTPNSTTTYTLTCTNASGLIAKYPATVTVTPEPDITSTSTPTGTTSFAPNTAQTFNGTVGNIGTGAGSNVPNILKVLNASGTSALAFIAASPSTVNIPANGGQVAVSGVFTATTTGTFLIEFCGNQNTGGSNVITEKSGGYGNNCSPPLSVNVAVATAPDIRGDGAPPQTTATVNVSQPFTGTVTNIGNATATNFPNVLQILDSTGTTNIARVAATPTPLTLAGGTTTSPTLTASYPFTSAGTYQVRFCGNMDTTGTQIITESNYANDCGAPQTVTVSAASTASISSCLPAPSSAATGTPITWTAVTSGFSPTPTSYTWSVSGGTPANQNGSPNTFTSTFQNGGDYSPTVTATNGTQTSAPFSCSSAHMNGQTDTCSLPTTPTITASQTRITSGSTVILNWSATGVSSGTSCTITGANVGGSNINTTTSTTADNLCDVNSSTNTTTITNITTQQVFTITCGAVSKQVVVDILPSYREF